MLPHLQRLNVLLAELRRRNVFRAVAVYSVASWVVVEVASTVLPVFPISDPDTVVRILVGGVVLLFPLVLVLAWVFDLTVEGVQRTEAMEEAPAAVSQFLRSNRFQATLVLMVLLLTGGAGWVSWRLWLRPGVEGGPASASNRTDLDPTRLAVLYFDDFSRGGELGYLANGITETLIHELAQIEALDVVSRNGVKPYRELNIPMDSLARILRAGSIVEGSVEGGEDRMIVTVQLIDGESEAHLMSERIEGRGEDVLALRDSIVDIAARSLGKALGRELMTRRTRRETSDPRAWELYQRAVHLTEDADTLRWARGDTVAAGRILLQADSLLLRAAELDGEWARPIIARGWLTRTRAGLFSASQSRRSPHLLMEGLELAEEALGRGPGNPEALELRGTLRADLARVRSDEESGFAEGALEDLRAAVDADPGRVMAWVTLADFLRIRGRFQEASIAAQHALEADPFLTNGEMEVLFVLSQVFLDLGEVERAARFVDAGRRRFPGDPSYPMARLVLLAGGVATTGAADTAQLLVRQIEEAYGISDWSLARLQMAAVLANEGMADSALVLLGESGGEGTIDPWVNYYAAKVRLNLGQEEEALQLLRLFLNALPGRRDYIARDWWWQPLREEPGFMALVGGEGGSLPPGGH
jgi:TolB-like protein